MGGKLVIRGYLKKVKVSRRGLVGDTGKAIDGKIIPDGRKEKFGIRSLQVWCFTLGNVPFDLLEDESVHQSILVMISQDHPGSYRRIAYFRGGSASSPSWWGQCDKVTITIV